MIQLPNNISPSQDCLNTLATFQAEIDKLPSYLDKTNCVENEWRNKSRRVAFNEVKEKLNEMCQGAKRCMYCEDSAADEVEHIYPKRLYPDKTFVWDNYLYACGTCNGPKQTKFALFLPQNATYTEITPSNAAPPNGDMVLINPRTENGMDFLMLDLIDTFQFVIISEDSTQEYQKGEYSLKILHLNDRDELCKARKNAYNNYKARLTAYIYQRDIENIAETELQNLVSELKEEGHKTVWREMQRLNLSIPELKKLFEQIPEALTW